MSESQTQVEITVGGTAPITDDSIGLTSDQSIEGLAQYEAGVSDLIAAYELAEQSYFPAARASAPNLGRMVASNSTQGF